MSARALIVGLALLLTGCATPPSTMRDTPEPGTIREDRTTLTDGRVVTCLIYDRDRGGALDCDWSAR